MCIWYRYHIHNLNDHKNTHMLLSSMNLIILDILKRVLREQDYSLGIVRETGERHLSQLKNNKKKRNEIFFLKPVLVSEYLKIGLIYYFKIW